MKVLVAFPKDGQTGKFIANGFRALGCEVRQEDSKKDPQYCYNAMAYGDFNLCVCSRTPSLHEWVTKRSGCKLVCWNTDVRATIGTFIKQFGSGLDKLWQQCDAIYTMAKGQVCDYRRAYPGKHVRWLSQGIDPDAHFVPPDGFLSIPGYFDYPCDVMFAGSYRKDGIHGSRWKILEEIDKRFNLNLWGYDNKIVDGDHNAACRAAKVCLGCSAYPDIELSMSVRDYKILGAGGILLTNNVRGIQNWFGDAAFYYDDIKGCLLAIERILKIDGDIINQMREQAAALVHSKHRYQDRCAVILDDLKKGLL